LGAFQAAYATPLVLAIACGLALPGCSQLETADYGSWICYDTLGFQGGPVASIAFSPDGSFIASTHSSLHPSNERPSPIFCGGYLNVWDVKMRLYQVSLLVDGLTLHPIRFRSDGKQCYVAVNQGVVGWDLEKSQRTQTPPTHVDTLSPDGQLVARLESDQFLDRLRVDDLQNENVYPEIFIPNGQLHGLAFSLDNQLLAIADGYGTPRSINLWNLGTNTQQCTIKLPHSLKFFPMFSPDGKRFATFSHDNTIGMWNTADGTLEQSFDGGERILWSIAFSPDGKLLAAGFEEPKSDQGGGVMIWNTSTGEVASEISEKPAWGVTAVAFSPDGKFLASGNSDGEIKLWRVPKEQAISTIHSD
jgi:WD40 repeat protein